MLQFGESEKRLREIFKQARVSSPCVLFFDEIQAVFRSRDGTGVHGQKMVSQLFLEMDYVHESGASVFVVATTNCPEDLDKHFFRAGK